MPANSSLTRVEREWADVPFQALDDLFELAGTRTVDEAQALGEGLAWMWITWYMALAKPVRRRVARRLVDYFPLPDRMRNEMLRTLAGDEAEAFKLLRNFMIGLARSDWQRRNGELPNDGTEDDDTPPSVDWDQWGGPGSV